MFYYVYNIFGEPKTFLMKKILPVFFLLFAFKSFSQTKNNTTTGTVFIADPDFYKRLLEKWNYQFIPAGHATKKDSATSLGEIIFWMVAPVKTDTGMWTPHISFSIYKKTDNEYCARISGKIHDNPNCRPELRGGEIYTLGDFLFLNKENCPNCMAYFTGADYCKSNVKLIFKNTKVDDKTTLPELIEKLPLEAGNFK